MRSCEELWAKGLSVQLSAYQHHAFLDWGLVLWDEQWQVIHYVLNGAGVESVQGKWEEMFGEKEELKKPVKRRTTRKKRLERRNQSARNRWQKRRLSERRTAGH